MRWSPLFAVAVIVTLTSTAHTAANTVGPSKAVNDVRTIAAVDLKPVECVAIAVTVTLSGSGTINGTAAAELITGSAAADNISAGQGNDCLLGGAGDDRLAGGPGTDVCIGGTGANTYAGCEVQL